MELNILYHTSIIENKATLYRQIFNDFWRRHFYSLSLNTITFVQQFWKNPEELFHDIFPYINMNIKVPEFQSYKLIQKSDKHIPTYYTRLIQSIDYIKKQWIIEQNTIINSIDTFNLGSKIYNKENLIRYIHIIYNWAQQKTSDHIVPKHLENFRSSTLQINKNSKNLYLSSLYCSIEELYQRLSLFPALIFNTAINEIRHNLNTTQYFRSEITFDDLITILLHHISKDNNNNNNNTLSKKILQNYPIAIIDEFQDTDVNQYKIFQKLYSNQSKKNSLILIGDPKQTIYSFRGSDIFTYIKIRKFLPYKYNLKINWRSSPGMVNAVNQLFQISNPFIFQDIPFIPLISAYQNRNYKFVIHKQPQQSVCFWLHPDNRVTLYNYKISMTKECVNTIQYLLYNIYHKTAWLENNKFKKKILKQSDITILVRNHEEASLIRSELLKIDISTTFLSNRKNIFETMESYELLLLLQAILFPTYNTVCTALTTIFFGLKAEYIEKIHNKCESQWTTILEEFSEYCLIWKRKGIFIMIQKIIFHYKIPEKLLSIKSGKNSLINILHLGELLNNITKQIPTQHALVQWLQSKIFKYTFSNKNEVSSDYILRYDDNYDSIKISTIHQSKGLEFPITFLPFIANFQYNKKILFHDRKSFQLHIDFNKSICNVKLSDEERLAEDLRLLYVAITRSIYHCSIGIAPIVHKYQKKNNVTDLHHSAIGYLIQNKQPGTASLLKKNYKI